jgi:hypothetical protein
MREVRGHGRHELFGRETENRQPIIHIKAVRRRRLAARGAAALFDESTFLQRQ